MSRPSPAPINAQAEHVRLLDVQLLSNDWYVLRKVTFELQRRDGQWQRLSREAYDRGNGATLLLFNPRRGTVVLTRQFRLPAFLNGCADGHLLEACAGLLDGDDPETCIRREAEEETGYTLTEVRKVFESYMSPGSVTEINHFFVGEYSKEMKTSDGGGLNSEHENIDVLELPFEKALEMISSGEIKDAKTIMLLQYAKINNLL